MGLRHLLSIKRLWNGKKKKKNPKHMDSPAPPWLLCSCQNLCSCFIFTITLHWMVLRDNIPSKTETKFCFFTPLFSCLQQTVKSWQVWFPIASNFSIRAVKPLETENDYRNYKKGVIFEKIHSVALTWCHRPPCTVWSSRTRPQQPFHQAE